MRLLLISPWPPQKTGIADYAYELVRGLINIGVKVSLITEAVEPTAIPGLDIYHIEELSNEEIQSYDALLYQIGNNTKYHLFSLQILFEHPGYVHLHDVCLHHLISHILLHDGKFSAYFELLKKYYGRLIKNIAEDYLSEERFIWESELVMSLPLFEPIVQDSLGCIVHSDNAVNMLHSKYPHKRILKIPQLYPDHICNYEVTEGPLIIGVFGGVDPNKQIEVILSALQIMHEHGISFELHIVGLIHDKCHDIYKKITSSQFKQEVFVHGRVSEQKFKELLSCVEVVVALRYPSVGETSAVVMRSLQLCIPTLVNDIGWYSELPAFVTKVKPNTSSEALEIANILTEFAADKSKLISKSNQIKSYAKQHYDYNSVVNAYAEYLFADIG
jgi:glycosyltransferase involved in cell wall biosynthesis